MRYIAFLRGINVGGKSLIKMDQLKSVLTSHGLAEVSTYIQSGNVIFKSAETDVIALSTLIRRVIKQSFAHDVTVALFTAPDWCQVMMNAPDWWGKDPDWKHNVLIVIPPVTTSEVAAGIGELMSGIEMLQPGKGVLYQSIAWSAVSKGTTGSKLLANRYYKQLTIRNFNTATKLAKLVTD